MKRKGRKINAEAMKENDKFHLLLSAQQQAVKQALDKSTPIAVRYGMTACYVSLYKEFLEPIANGEDQKEMIDSMISRICERYLQAIKDGIEEKPNVEYDD